LCIQNNKFLCIEFGEIENRIREEESSGRRGLGAGCQIANGHKFIMSRFKTFFIIISVCADLAVLDFRNLHHMHNEKTTQKEKNCYF